MAGRLKPGAWRPGPRRLGLLLLALLSVLLLHALLGQALWVLHPGAERARFPERLAVVFLQELQAQAPMHAPRLQGPRPPPAPPVAEPQAAAITPATAASGPAQPGAAASAPEPAAVETPPEALPLAEPALAASEPALLAAAAASAASAASAAGEVPGPEWPLSTQLRYRLNGYFRGEVTGEAEVQWLRQGTRYQVHLDVLVGASFAPLIQRRMSSDGQLGAQGIAPLRYDEDTKVLMRERRRSSIVFDREARQLRLPDGSQQALPAGVQDAASQFVHLTWLFLTGREQLEPGRIVALPLALPRRLYAWRYEVLGQEMLDTPMGSLAAWHLRPLLDRETRPNDLKAEVWLAPSLQYLPVRLRIAQDEQTYLDLMLRAAPRQAAQ